MRHVTVRRPVPRALERARDDVRALSSTAPRTCRTSSRPTASTPWSSSTSPPSPDSDRHGRAAAIAPGTGLEVLNERPSRYPTDVGLHSRENVRATSLATVDPRRSLRNAPGDVEHPRLSCARGPRDRSGARPALPFHRAGCRPRPRRRQRRRYAGCSAKEASRHVSCHKGRPGDLAKALSRHLAR
jgi:hypothetical protein